MFNAESTIVEALDSVRKQTVGTKCFEVIVINDGSADKSSKVVEHYMQSYPEMNIQLLNQENKGVSSARNAGLEIAKGDYIAFLDADDIWLPEKTKKQIDYLENKLLKIDFISSKINGNKILFPYYVKNKIAKVSLRKLLIRNGIPSPTALFKRKIIENTGFFDENQRHAEDHNYWLKISIKNTMCILDESLVIAGKGKRTFGVSGLSGNLSAMEKGFKKNLQDILALNKITLPEYFLYRIFYKAKYGMLVIRNLLSNYR